MTLKTMLLAACVAFTPFAAGTMRDSPGGNIDDFETAITALFKSGEQVRISGKCMSGCTLVLALPAERVCAVEGATFWFHQPYWTNEKGEYLRQFSKKETAKFMALYPKRYQDLIKANGGLKQTWLWFDATDLVAKCPYAKPDNEWGRFFEFLRFLELLKKIK